VATVGWKSRSSRGTLKGHWEGPTVQPRGQLWFELERVCHDFRSFSGLEETEALRVLAAVLANLLGDVQAELAELQAEPGSTAAPGEQATDSGLRPT
jgi:hypothetical protein